MPSLIGNKPNQVPSNGDLGTLAFQDSNAVNITGGTVTTTSTTIGTASANPLTINSSAVSIPNGLNFDSNTFVIDATNNRVGIGNAAPAHTVDIQSASGGTTARLRNTTGNFIDFIETSGSSRTGYIGTTNGTNFVIHNDKAGQMQFDTNNLERMRITDTGNVGIGTSSPSGRLSVTTSTMTNQIIADSMSDSTTYGLVSLNGSRTSTSYLGIAGGGGTDTTMFLNVPSGGAFSFRNAFTERMRLDSSGNLGLGVTPSAWGFGGNLELPATNNIAFQGSGNLLGNAFYSVASSGYLYKTTSGAVRYELANSQHRWYVAPSGTAGNAISFTQAMTLDASGNLVVGATSASLGNLNSTIAYGGADAGIIYLQRQTGTDQLRFYTGGNRLGYVNTASSTLTLGTANFPLVFATNDTERARIDSSGNLLVGRTSTFTDAKFIAEGSSTSFISRLRNTSATTPSGLFISYTGAAPNGTGDLFFRADDNAATRVEIRSNGGIANYSANNVNLSDARTKTDIELAGSYLDKVCAIPVKTFKYKDQTDDLLNLGVIAQDVEAVAPELVDVSGFGETPEDGVPLKAIYQTDLVYALMKSIQELKAELDTVKAELNTLKGN